MSLRQCSAFLALCLALPLVEAATFNPSQQPLFLTTGVGPNFFITIDNSTSMQMAVVPDASNNATIRPTRRAKSATFNGLYYNPAVTYAAPYKVVYDASTGILTKTRLTTSFTAAYVNGFRTGLGTVDLSSNYKVSWGYNPNISTTDPETARGTTYANPGLATGSVSTLAENPSADFPTVTSTTSSTGSSTRTNNVTYTTSASFCPSSISDSSSTSGTTSTTSNGVTTSSYTTTRTSYSNISCSFNFFRYTVRVTTTSTPTTYTTTTSDGVKAGVAAYYYIYDTKLSTCTTIGTRNDDCYRKVTVSNDSGLNGSDERQNFANWYSFYRSRSLAAQSATNLAMIDVDENIRVGWQALGSCTFSATSPSCRGINNSSSSAYDNRLRPFSGSHRQALFDWLGDIYYDSSTPLHSALARVGNFLSTTGINGPYAYSPGSTEAPIYACRASYSLMVTDGVWNANYDVAGEDSNSQELGDGRTYSPMAPYQDLTKDTLADLAFQYWYRDANRSLDNKIPPYTAVSGTETHGDNKLTSYWNPKNDPATWQHLTGFYVGIGLSSALTSPVWGGDTYSGGYDAIAAGTLSWPKAASGSDNNVYDLWHAAINSRGAFFSADDAGDLVSSLGAVVTRITQSNNASASQVSSPMLDNSFSSSYTYVPTFSSSDWSGDLGKYLRTAKSVTRQWSAQSKLDATYGSGSYTGRKVVMARSANTLQDFKWTNLSATQKAYLNKNLLGTVDSYGSQRVDYLRGARTYENSATTPSFRIRSHILGDIVNSTPVQVTIPSSPEAKMNALVSSASGSYTAFRQKWASRATRIYVGGNDGMLHGFDDGGNEKFAFIPSAVLPTLYKLTDVNYTGGAHQFYVDGSPVVQDVYLGTDWHTVLIGTLRGGGRGLFALDITDPDDIKLLWEKSSSDYPQLGYTYAKPVVTRLQNGSWAVVLGNGYGSSWTNNGAIQENSASLYLLNVSDGSLISQLTASASGTALNGLSSPLVADVNNDLIADYAYAGDLQGRLWRFDLVGSSATSYSVAFGGKTPLYSALASSYSSGLSSFTQAITAAPYLVRHPSGTGYLIVFGTGKYLEGADATANTTKAMTLYGIWDRQATGTAASTTPTLTVANLQQQTLGADTGISYTSSTGNSVASTANTLSTTAVDWYTSTNTAGKYGWYVNLPLTGEMVINKAQYISDTLLFTSLVPNDDPCDSGAVTYLYALNPYTGGGSDLLELGLDTSYSRLKLAGLYGGASIFTYGNSVVISGTSPSTTTTLTNADGSVTTTTLDPSLPNSTDTKRKFSRQTWRTIPNQNPDE